ncbi:MAG TPA: hypothetical protein VMM83_03985 [Longimicrobiales bacterium]|nr:hypothetical protein [Longimicrobiales bacterium]
MDHLVVVPHPVPIALEARSIRHGAVPEGAIGLGYYYDGRLIARSVVAAGALDTIQSLLATPVSVALAAREDEEGNIDGRICLVLPVEPDGEDGAEGAAVEDWRESVPTPPPEVESGYTRPGGGEGEEAEGDGSPQYALLPIGNVVRPAEDRRHPDDVANDAKEMLESLLAGGGKDAVQKAIDDLLESI